MADNFFDQFDAGPAKPAAPTSGNFFDQYDSPATGVSRTPEGRLRVVISKPSSPDASIGAGKISAADAALSGAVQGLTGNFFDEMQGARAASGLPDFLSGAFQVPVGAARLAYEHLTGQPGEATRAYDDAVKQVRDYQQKAQEQHPIASAVGNVGGALATAMLPVGAAGAGASLPARMAAGAGAGGAYGALYGAGEGNGVEDRATRAASGAVTGAALGGAAPAILSGVGKAAGAVSDYAGKIFGHPIDTYRAFRNTDEEAARKIGTAIIGDIQNGRGGMTASDLSAAAAAGQPTAVVDVGGEGTRALARSAANTSPAARAAISDMAQARFQGQSARIAAYLRTLVPTPANATRTQEALDAAARAAHKPAYARAYAAGDKSINSPELERLMGSPDVVSAMRSAVQSGKSRAIADGFGAFNAGVKITDDGRVVFQNGKNGAPAYPNIQFWDYTYRSLRDSANAAFRAGRNDEGSYLSGLSKQLRSELDSIVPEYHAARAGAASFFGAENALEAGRNFVSMRGPVAEARAAYNKMSAPERALFAEGFVSDLVDKVSKISDNRSVTIDRIFNSPDGRSRIGMALGQQRAQELEMFMRRENMMDQVRMGLGNSTTARQLMELGIAGGLGAGAEAAITGNADYKTILTGALVSAAAAGHRSINVKLAQRVGEMLASDDPRVLQSALRMAANPNVGGAMRRAEGLIERLVGQGSGNSAPMLPVAGAGRADQQQ